MRKRMILLLCAVLALTVGVATATADGGNSENAKLCQDGGWQDWVHADRTPFKNEGDCVSYAAQGGTLTPSTTQTQLDCESFGGTFTTGAGWLVWMCTDWVATDLADWTSKRDRLSADCQDDTVGAGAIVGISTSSYIVPGLNFTGCTALWP